MTSKRILWLAGMMGALSLATIQGCGDDESDDGAGGSAGASAGSAGKGGSSGKGGSNGAGGDGNGTGGDGNGTGGDGNGTGGTAGTANGTGGDGSGTAGNGSAGDGAGGSSARAEACGDYCSVYFNESCDDHEENSYDDEADCVAACESASEQDFPIGEPGDMAGNTVYCKRNHAEMATQGGSDVHCGHAVESPTTGPCQE